jgi:hypothetical protein
MFTSSNHQQRRRVSAGRPGRPGRGLSRRLRVEAMEGRLMLAGTTIDLAPLSLEAAEIHLSAVRSNLDQHQTLFAATLTEGGFVTNQFTVFTPSALDSDSGAVAADDRGAGYVISLQSPVIQGFDSPTTGATRGALANLYEAGLDRSWTLFDITGVLNDGTTPQVMGMPLSPVTNSATLGQELKPLLNELVANRAPESEGGLIPIQPILGAPNGGSPSTGIIAKTLRPESPLEEAPPKLLAATSKVSTATMASTTSSTAVAEAGDPAIYAEWARAMVFETAGGEPERNNRVDAAEEEEFGPLSTGPVQPPADQPLPSQRAIWATGARGSGDAATEWNGEPSSIVSWDDPSDRSPIGGGVLAASWRAADEGAAEASNAAVASRASTGAIGPAGSSAGLDLARAAVFDEIGGGEVPLARSFAHDLARGSLGATPLLMVLALERIATGNSRREKQAASTASPKLARP